MERLNCQDLRGTDVSPGSTLRPITRFELVRGSGVAAEVTLGRAEVFERQPLEYTLARWSFPPGDLATGSTVLSAGAEAAVGGVALYLDIAGSGPDADDRCAIARDCGFELAVERCRLGWVDGEQPLIVSPALTFRSLAEVGRDRLAEVMADAATTTLDRNDSRSLSRQNAREWAHEFIGQDVRPADEHSWLLVESTGGESIGVVGISAVGDSAILCYLCVRPHHRGRRLGEQLVYAGYGAARQRGLAKVYAYVDAANRPMIAALERCGAKADGWRRRLLVRC